MKKYEKPSIELIEVGTTHIIMESETVPSYEVPGNPENQGAPSRKYYIEDDLEDDGDYGW